ncbi:MAG: undecaprenyl/decaprenyl-phosphate alpha-N-acetylglucosaminyl 1-phosphate transferase [Anaerolineae bacterium]|nr:undecaprenyl/decaprenyl-phosphate alpha-N-acetylglucosaminyl 1-phosphate transferase [Anaerolineae bacterium]
MQLPLIAFGLTFGLAFLLSLGLTPLARVLGERWGLVARPGGRRKHERPISCIGGVPVYIAFVVAVLASQLLVIDPHQAAELPPGMQIVRFDGKEIIRLTGLLLSGTIIFLAGLYDDWRELSPLPQYIAQIIAAAIAVLFLILIEYVNNPLTGQQTPDFAYPITVTLSLFWLGLMINTVNWLDGVDGLAAGVVAIACVVLFINGVFRLEPPQYSVALLPMALLGATLGFLPFNFAPARIFLGSGAYFLGFTLGALSIIGGAKMASILLVMGLPLLDVAWQVINRLARGQNPVQGDRGHLHFRLVDMGLSPRQIVIGYYLFSAVFGGLALAIPSRLYKLIAMLVMAAISLVGFIWLARRGEDDVKTLKR